MYINKSVFSHMMEIELTSVEEAEYPLLVEVWEDSVRATHDFLRPADREFYRTRMPFYLRSVCLTAARTADGRIVAFLGTDGDRIEMLFVYSAYRGCGIGKRLITHAIHALGCRCVEVNEQNEQAAGFYRRMGFVPVGRSARDGEGMPYPLLQLVWRPEEGCDAAE